MSLSIDDGVELQPKALASPETRAEHSLAKAQHNGWNEITISCMLIIETVFRSESVVDLVGNDIRATRLVE
jgi:hypothetical protein